MENNVITVNYKNKQITLIPTAHVSKQSSLLVEQVIDEIQPDSICVELDEDRYRSLMDPDSFRHSDITKIIKEKKVALLLVNLILSNYQKRLAGKLDSSSGAEMLAGIRKAQQTGANLVLADRKVSITFKRIWANMNLADKIRLLSSLISAIFDDEEITEEELSQLEQTDMLQAALKEVSDKFPKITEVLVDERDMYLADKIRNAPGKKVVAVLGAAHTLNIPKYFEESYDIAAFDTVPPKTPLQKASRWIIPVIIVAAILFSFRIDPKIGLNQIKSWIVINGTLSAIGALIARGHPLSILTAFAAAPITSLNPLLAAGWFAGLVEAKIRKPTVEDFSRLSEDTSSLAGFWKNKVTRILMLVLFASLGSSIGTFVSGFSIIKSLFGII